MSKEAQNQMEKIVSFAKRRGFIFPGSEIYGGLAGTWDYGPVGTELKNNIRSAWWKRFVHNRSDMYGLDSAILMNAKVWEASGHIAGFSDPMVDCKSCKSRFRADHLAEGKYGEVKMAGGKQVCPVCGKNDLTEARPFNMMFRTWIGPMEETANEIYLRPENAQGMFVDFKNVLDTMHPKLPFGIAQTGRVFRNEITPGDFIFRVREFDLMEFEYFIDPKDWEELFEMWLKEIAEWLNFLGLDAKKIYNHDIPDGERAHYSRRTTDIEYEFPFGMKELCAIAYRTDYDLLKHQEYSKKDLTYFDEATKSRFIPHVLEPTFGLDRAFLATLVEAYTEEELEKGDTRVVLKLPRTLAPYKVAVFPLVSNKENITAKAREVYAMLKPHFHTAWDDIGNIGKRYRRQDEIGTPWCVTIDYDTLENNTVTVRDRDSMKQERVAVDELQKYFEEKLK
ncbi:MAG: glycine--tRNA ligase [bacterium]|nr:glycine--tRNA ligase [bacterium]